jgi:hypothetical protein
MSTSREKELEQRLRQKEAELKQANGELDDRGKLLYKTKASERGLAAWPRAQAHRARSPSAGRRSPAERLQLLPQVAIEQLQQELISLRDQKDEASKVGLPVACEPAGRQQRRPVCLAVDARHSGRVRAASSRPRLRRRAVTGSLDPQVCEEQAAQLQQAVSQLQQFERELSKRAAEATRLQVGAAGARAVLSRRRRHS